MCHNDEGVAKAMTRTAVVCVSVNSRLALATPAAVPVARSETVGAARLSVKD